MIDYKNIDKPAVYDWPALCAGQSTLCLPHIKQARDWLTHLIELIEAGGLAQYDAVGPFIDINEGRYVKAVINNDPAEGLTIEIHLSK